MLLKQFSELLQANLTKYVKDTNGLDGFGIGDMTDSLSQIVIDTLNTMTDIVTK